MNKLLLFLIFIFGATSLIAQNVVIDGVTFSADKKTLIKYPGDKPGREYVIPEGTEVVGKKAFSEIGFGLEEVTFPTTLTLIADSAFYRGPLYFILTGKFPIIGNHVWDGGRSFKVPEDNSYCQVSDGFIYSKDGKILHLALGYDAGYLDDIEIIDRYAFQNCWFRYGDVDIPCSVRVIREHAFDDIRPAFPTRSDPSYFDFNFTCGALIPPELEGEVFNKNNVGCSTLYVPEESEALYKAAPQWNAFGTIKGYSPGPPQGISENSVSALKINRMNGAICIEALKPLKTLLLINTDGSAVREKSHINGCRTTFDISSLNGFVGLLQVVFEDGSIEVVKLNF